MVRDSGHIGSGWLAFSVTIIISHPQAHHSRSCEWARVVAGHAQMVLVDLLLWPEPVLWNLQLCDLRQGILCL